MEASQNDPSLLLCHSTPSESMEVVVLHLHFYLTYSVIFNNNA